ncbi:MAG: DUF2095 family protein [Promethearchaeota archaeon]
MKQKKKSNIIPKELIDPGAIDFIRRCTTKEEAFEILDYLLERKELSLNKYKNLKNNIKKEGGLEKLINKYGGLKKPGYYLEKYYKNLNNG